MSETWIETLRPLAPSLAKALETSLKPAAEALLARALSTPADQLASQLQTPPTGELADKLRRAETEFLAQIDGLRPADRASDAQREKAILDDIADARKSRGGATNRVALAVMLIFVATVAAAFCLLYLVTGKGTASGIDEKFFNVIVALLGTVLGYVAGYAQQVVGFYFGSSFGSVQKGDTISRALRDLEKKS